MASYLLRILPSAKATSRVAPAMAAVAPLAAASRPSGGDEFVVLDQHASPKTIVVKATAPAVKLPGPPTPSAAVTLGYRSVRAWLDATAGDAPRSPSVTAAQPDHNSPPEVTAPSPVAATGEPASPSLSEASATSPSVAEVHSKGSPTGRGQADGSDATLSEIPVVLSPSLASQPSSPTTPQSDPALAPPQQPPRPLPFAEASPEYLAEMKANIDAFIGSLPPRATVVPWTRRPPVVSAHASSATKRRVEYAERCARTGEESTELAMRGVLRIAFQLDEARARRRNRQRTEARARVAKNSSTGATMAEAHAWVGRMFETPRVAGAARPALLGAEAAKFCAELGIR